MNKCRLCGCFTSDLVLSSAWWPHCCILSMLLYLSCWLITLACHVPIVSLYPMSLRFLRRFTMRLADCLDASSSHFWLRFVLQFILIWKLTWTIPESLDWATGRIIGLTSLWVFCTHLSVNVILHFYSAYSSLRTTRDRKLWRTMITKVLKGYGTWRGGERETGRQADSERERRGTMGRQG